VSEFSVGQLAQDLASGYYAHAAAIAIARNPRAAILAPPTLPGHLVPIGLVGRKDGTEHAFDFRLFLERGALDLADQFDRVWLTGALLELGDALAAERYFDRAPVLELIYHLRNGIAHGNRITIDSHGRKRLTLYPAHNRQALIRGDKLAEFEIGPGLNGSAVLFDLMGPADVLDLFMSVADHLLRIADGQPGLSPVRAEILGPR
jgi:hypothetical protein